MKQQNNYEQKYSEMERAKKMLGFKHEDSLPFTPYFVYEIGVRTHPYHLVFKEMPNRELYQNTLINILSDFSSVEESIECMEYHYENYPSKEQYLRHFKFSFPYRIEVASSKDTKLRLKTCLAWVEDIYEGYKMDPIYVGARVEIKCIDNVKTMAFMKYILQQIINEKTRHVAMEGSNLSVALLLTHFKGFKNKTLGTLNKEVGTLSAVDLPDNLKKELRDYFFGIKEDNV